MTNKTTIFGYEITSKVQCFSVWRSFIRHIEGEAIGNPFTCIWELVHSKMVDHLMLESNKKNIKLMVRFVDDVNDLGKRNDSTKWLEIL